MPDTMLNAHPLLLNDCVLRTDRIDIWRYPLTAENQAVASFLSPSEQIRAKRFHFPRHQRRFTNAHSGLRLILARYINDTARNLAFTEGKQGKPQLSNVPLVQFNLSHSGEMALLVIGQQYPIGIDLEYFSARTYYGIGEHLFSIKENQALKKAPPTLTALVFFNIWVQKEALIKACGLGLSYPTQQFDVPILSSDSTEIYDALHQRTWQMRTFMPQINCCAAVCHDPHIQTIRYAALTESQLVELAHDSIK
ncbi:MAG: 4'-phosphopantetheinyl transferase superfamily protein [Pseudomonadota bacterium]